MAVTARTDPYQPVTPPARPVLQPLISNVHLRIGQHQDQPVRL
jgi:hypothetical protein